MNAVIYARYSSDKQTEQSIEGQLRVCQEYAARNDITIIDEYIDRAMTGTNDKRPAFLQMIEDSEKKQFEYILVYKLDRFSRNKYDNVIYKHKLEQFGVKVISATEVISDTPEGRLMEGLLEMFAEMYSRELSQKVKRGMRENILKGNSLGGIPLYGYKVVDKKIYIDEEKAPAIRYLFEEYAKGKPKKQIIEELNAKGYRLRNGKKITYNSWQNNLSNQKYTGVYTNGELQSTELYPAIISKELFDEVQKRLEIWKHKPALNKGKTEFLLTGKLFCGYCHGNMVGISGTSRLKIRYHYYTCYNRWKNHSCHKENEKQEELEDYLIAKTVEYVLDKNNLEKISEGIVNCYGTDVCEKELISLRKQIKSIDNKIDVLGNRYIETKSKVLMKKIDDEVESLSVQKEDLEKEISKLNKVKIISKTKADVKAVLKQFVKGSLKDRDYKKKIINCFINSVYLYDDKLVVIYRVFGDNKVIEYEQLVRFLNGVDNQCKERGV